MVQFNERQLGIHEEMFWHLDVAMPLNLTISPKISGPLNINKLKVALDLLQKRHPLLRAHIVTHKNNPYFKNSDMKIPLNIIEGDEQVVNQVVDNYTNERFNAEREVLIKATLVKSKDDLHYLVLGFHHAITDGRSMVLLVRDIMILLNQLDEGVNDGLPVLPMEPPYETSLPESSKGLKGYFKWNYVLLRLIAGIVKSGLFIKGFPNQSQVPLKKRTMRTFHHYLEPDESRRVIEFCKKHNVTVHTAMHTAFALSAAGKISTQNSTPMFLGTVADVRNDLVPKTSDATGLFASVMGAAQKVTPHDDFWALAARVQHQLKKDVELNVSHVLTKFQFKPINWLARKLSEKNINRILSIVESMQPKSIPLSNLGLLRVLEQIEGERKVLEIRGSVAVSILGNISGGAATMHDRIYTFVGACEPLVNSEEVKAYQIRAAELLVNACQ